MEWWSSGKAERAGGSEAKGVRLTKLSLHAFALFGNGMTKLRRDEL